jgi:hypothetical protein
MANVTEKEIISYLKEKIKSIQAEAKKYEDLLNAFNGSSTPTKSAKQTKENLLDAVLEEAEDASTTKASKKKADTKPAKGGKAAVKALEVPAEYSTDLGLSGKIAFALNEIGEGFGQDIAAAMAQYEPQSDAEKIFKQIASVLSNLKAKGVLTTVKEGRRDKYALAK